MANRIIGIVSGKGGVGKTVTSVNLSLSLHNFGEPVTLVDADTTVSNVGLHLGFYKYPNELQHVLNGEVEIDKATYMHHTGLKVIPSSLDLDTLGTDVSRLRDPLKALNGIVIIDAPPGLDNDSRMVLEACDDLIIVTNPEIPTVTNALKVSRVAQKMKKNILGIILNRVTGEDWELKIPEIEMMCELPVIGIVPEDREVKRSIFSKTPLVVHTPYSPASVAYKGIAAKVIGRTYVPPKNLRLKRFLRLLD